MTQFQMSSKIQQELALFCRRWQIVELSLFGSALGEYFGQESDIDLLATFAPTSDWSYLDHMQMELELVDLFRREVDLVERESMLHRVNPHMRAEIEASALPLYTIAGIDRVAGH